MPLNLPKKYYATCWKARIAIPSQGVEEAKIIGIAKEGLKLKYAYSLSVGQSIGIEFYVSYRGKQERVRAKTCVTHNTISSAGTIVELAYTSISKEYVHMLGNVMHLIENN